MMSIRLLLLAPLAGLLACHDDKATEPVTPPPPMTAAPTPSPAPASTTTRTSARMTTTGIYLDASIATACGIPQPKVFFTFDSANVQNMDTDTLERLSQCVSSGPLKGKPLEVVGRTDPRGTDEYNKQLGQSRADAVAGLLASRGVDRAMLTTRSTGEERATGNDENGWAYDRRVDIRLARNGGSGSTSGAPGDTSTSGSTGSGVTGSGSGSGSTGSGSGSGATGSGATGSGATGSGATGSGSTGTSGSTTNKGSSTGAGTKGTKGSGSGSGSGTNNGSGNGTNNGGSTR